MKNNIVCITLISVVFFGSCEKKTITTVNDEGEITTVEKIGFDEEQIDSAAQNMKLGVKDVAKKTGEAVENAVEKLETEAEKAEDNLKKSTGKIQDTAK